MSFSAVQQITVLRDSVNIARRKLLADADDVSESDLRTITIDGLLEFIERQRLTHMPHRGSHWDNVWKWAEFFALQILGYAAALESFVPESMAAAQLIWSASRSLLRGKYHISLTRTLAHLFKLGPENAQALAATFGVFYRLGLSVSMLLRNDILLSANSRVRTEVSQAFNTLVVLVCEVSLYYTVRLHGPA